MVRAVAQDALRDGERAEALDRLLVSCIDELAVIAADVLPPPGLDAEVRQDHTLHVVAAEHALATAQTELGLRLVHGLFEAWHGVGQRSTLDRWMNRFVAQTDGPSQVRGMVLRRQAIIASEQLGDYDRAMRLLDCAEADALAISDQHLLGKVRGTRAGLDLDAGRLDGLESRLSDAIALLEAAGGDYVANVLTTLGMLYAQRAEFDQAEDALLRAHDANRDWFQNVEIELSRAWCSLLVGRLDVAAVRAATTLDLAEQTGDTDLIAHAIEIAALAALAGGDVEVSQELLVRMVAFCREHELANLADGLAGLAIVSVLRGDSEVARACRDEVQGGQHPGTAESVPYRRLAAAFVDLAEGDAGRAAAIASEVRAEAAQLGAPYFHVLGNELLAASIAATDPMGARQLLGAADDERRAVGAAAWPLEPYRDTALRTLESLSMGASDQAGMRK